MSALPTFALQESMWLLEQASGMQPLVFSALKISGRLDCRRLQHAIDAVIQRHELLRCGFTSSSGRLLRFMTDRATSALYCIDLAGPGRGDVMVCLEMVRPCLERMRMSLAEPPLLKFCLLRVDAVTHVLCVVMHHIICDEHSNDVLCGDLVAAYAGRPFARPDVGITEYLRRQQDDYEGVEEQEARDYWSRRMAGYDASVPIYDLNRRLRSRDTGHALRSTAKTLEIADVVRIKKLCRIFRCTPSVLLLGVMQLWLIRCSAGRAPAICVPMQLREDLQSEALLGFFTNLVVIRCEFSDSDTASHFFQRLRNQFYAAWTHRRTPFTEVSAGFKTQREAAFAPLSRFMFALETTTAALDPSGTGLTIEPLLLDRGIPGAEFAFIVTSVGDEFRVRVQYDQGAVVAAWAESAIPQMLGILRTLDGDPGMQLSRVCLEQLAPGQSRLPAALPVRRRTVYERFRHSCMRSPSAVAVYDTAPHDFAGLGRRVDNVTELLLQNGVKQGDLVGLALKRNIGLVAAQLAVLRLGAAYVPMSSDWTPATVAKISRGLQLVLTDGEASIQPLECPVRVLSFDRQLRADFSAPTIDPQTPAYVLYTSGSTGKPKGVAVSHRALECFIEWAEHYFGCASDGVVFGCTPTIFDMSIAEVLVAPCTGMATVMVDHPAAAIASPCWQQVTWITGVPTVLREMFRSVDLPPRVELITFGGEELDRAIVQRLQRAAPTARIMNLYGPTEITVYATGAQLDVRDTVDPATIGTPLRFHEVHIVDTAFNELPSWAVGQIAVGGPCVALGYPTAADTTAVKFCPDPFSIEPGARLHLTGDLGFTDAQGSIHLLGRLDSQEKILGVRVHLGGVEAVLRSHPEVDDAACLVMHKGTSAAYLAAALVSRTPQTPDTEEFRTWMQRSCTASHVPRQWVWLDKLPTRPGGKVDRDALRVELERVVGTRHSSPMSPFERNIASIWNRILATELADVDLNFFDAGGNSLLLPRLCHELLDVGLKLSLSEIFAYPTVRAQGRLLAERRMTPDLADRVADSVDRAARMRSSLAQYGPVRAT